VEVLVVIVIAVLVLGVAIGPLLAMRNPAVATPVGDRNIPVAGSLSHLRPLIEDSPTTRSRGACAAGNPKHPPVYRMAFCAGTM